MALKVVVVGAGHRGRDWLREVRASPAYELAAFVDDDRAVLQDAASSLDIPSPQCFAELDKALDQNECDAVIVASSADRHVRPCKTALSRKLAVLVEKPFTLRLEEATKLVALAEQSGVPLLVAQNFRYMRAFRTARRLIQDGTLGRVGMVTFQYYRVPHEMASSLARLEHSVLWGIGVHHLDALRFVLGGRVTGVVADSYTTPWGELPPGASLRVMLSFDNGTRASYSATYESSGHEFFERGQEFYGRFVGEKATLHVFQRWLLLCARGKLPRVVRRGSRSVTEEGILLRQLERALLAGEASDSSGRDNLQTMAIVEACVRSATEHRWIDPRELLNESD